MYVTGLISYTFFVIRNLVRGFGIKFLKISGIQHLRAKGLFLNNTGVKTDTGPEFCPPPISDKLGVRGDVLENFGNSAPLDAQK